MSVPCERNTLNKQNIMKVSIFGICLLILGALSSHAQGSAARNEGNTKQEIISLSKDKWKWMADKDVDKLAALFHDRSKFVHMSGTWNKNEELDVIKTGSIWYKKADVHDVVVELFDDTAILWNRITLLAVVRGSEVSTQFTVTEVYKKLEKSWSLLDLTFSSVRDTHTIQH